MITNKVHLPSVLAAGVGVQLGRDAVPFQRRVVADAVAGQHVVVVVAHGDEGGWRPGCHFLLAGVKRGIRRHVGSEQVAHRLAVDHPLVARDSGVHQYREVGPVVRSRESGRCGRCQMSSGREAHDAYAVRIDMPQPRLFPDHSYGRQRVFDRNVGMSVRHPVAQHDGRDTPLVQPPGDLYPFVVETDSRVASSRTDHDGLACGPVRIGRVGQVVGLRSA